MNKFLVTHKKDYCWLYANTKNDAYKLANRLGLKNVNVFEYEEIQHKVTKQYNPSYQEQTSYCILITEHFSLATES